MIKCASCGKTLTITQSEHTKNFWKQNKGIFVNHPASLKSNPACSRCRTTVEQHVLAEIGLKNIARKRAIGFGTKFYEVYKNSATIYNQFSIAEDPENIITKEILGRIKKPTDTILDIGCGTGKYSILLAPHCQTYFALEPSPTLLRFAKDVAAAKNMNNIIHLLAQGENIPLMDQSVDLVISTWAAYSPNNTFPEILRVLKPKGTIIRVGIRDRDSLTMLYAKFSKQDVDSNNQWFRNHGFRSINKTINIVFKSLSESKKVLSAITGAKPEKLKSKKLKHKIIINILSL